MFQCGGNRTLADRYVMFALHCCRTFVSHKLLPSKGGKFEVNATFNSIISTLLFILLIKMIVVFYFDETPIFSSQQ